IMCLDVLRALYKEPETVEAFMTELEAVAGHSKALDAYIATLKMQIISMKKAFVKKDFPSLETYELTARRFVERLAIAIEAVLMIKQAPSFAADAFVSSRIEQKAGFAYGTLDSSADNLKQIITRSYTV
ncbi:MAG: hypothetical protein K2X81_05850, partial [Candidatus Obscuribacterales bacterium]|nr:hypothetical protein [Candidatus Obscuribacterales bacterium]